MSYRIRKDALLRIGEDALLDVGCFLNRFDVDSIQCLTWKSHTYLANKSHILPVRLLERAQIGGYNIGESQALSPSISARKCARGTVSFNGPRQESLQLSLAAIKDSDVKYLDLLDPAGAPITDQEADSIASVAATMKVTELCMFADLTHLSSRAFHCLLFSFTFIKELTLHRVNGNQLTEEHLHEWGRRHMWNLCVSSDWSDAAPSAFGDEAVLDYLYAPEGETRRRVRIPAFNASPQFVQKLINRARLAKNVDYVFFEVQHLPLQSQQLDGLQLAENYMGARSLEQLEDGTRVLLDFVWAVSSRRIRKMDEEEEFHDSFRFIHWK